MLWMKKQGFTLVELLVVISIIGVLAAALTTQFTKVRSNAQSIKCKANLRNLAQAALTYGADSYYTNGQTRVRNMPVAGAHEWMWPEMEGDKYVPKYHERKGWVNWTGGCKWTSTSAQASRMALACFNGTAREVVEQSIKGGTLWTYVGMDFSSYVCEEHRRVAIRKGCQNVRRSYVMNGYFGYENKGHGNLPDWREFSVGSISARGNAGGLLMFAELPAYVKSGASHTEKIDKSGVLADSVLATDILSSGRDHDDNGQDATRYLQRTEVESMGFNHRMANKFVAHVAFADGHVDVIAEPDSADGVKELTKLLCNGDEVSQTLRDQMR